MTKELRRISIIVLVMFLALFASTTWIQGVQADELSAHPANKRTQYDSYQVERGSIIVEGSAIASSVPSNDVYAFQRVYTDSALWAQITGYYNPVLGSATGLEGVLNQQLSGTGAAGAFARLEQVISGQPPRGSSVELTLSSKAQRAAVDALQGLQGAIVALDPRTGRILAMASTPGFDANPLASHDGEAVQSLYQSLLDNTAQPLVNRAIGGNMNPPGSTFKLVVASAALENGYTPQSTFPNVASYQLPQSSNRVFNAGGGTCGPGDRVTLADALRLSCNIPFAELAGELGAAKIRATAERFGFNQQIEVPLKAAVSVYPKVLDAPQTALSGFGQSDVRATPLQMAMVSAGIANGGSLMAPQMVERVIGPTLAVQQEYSARELARSVDPGVASQLTTMMVANVSSGAASNARIDGVDVAGKTGTAENGNLPYSLWFTGFAPASNPQVAVAVVVENGGGKGQTGSGNEIAAPLAKKVIEAVLHK